MAGAVEVADDAAHQLGGGSRRRIASPGPWRRGPVEGRAGSVARATSWCAASLVRWGLLCLVHQIETRCQPVAYFACTSLGRMPDATSRPLAGRGVLPPLLRNLQETS